jgi:probable F420-dependent oxidoreductase
VRLGVGLPTVGPSPEREYVLDVARAADRLGFDSVWVGDHVVLPSDRRTRYPYQRSTTEVTFSPGFMWLDPIATMGFAAAATERVLIGTNVLVVPYRNPLILANELATVDRLSGGRAVLGIGVGWMDEEFEALGIPRRERGARTDEAILAMRTLWSADGSCSFEGRFISFRDLALATSPITLGGPPVWVGGNEEPALRRALRLGDGWLGFEVFLEDVPEVRNTLDRLGTELDRDPSHLELSVRRGLVPPFDVTNFLSGRRAISGSADEVASELNRYGDAGVSLVVLDLAFTIPEMITTMEWLAADVMPRLN